MTKSALEKRIAELEAKLEAKGEKEAPPLSCKVSSKGAVSVYGLQRFPVTLYRSQWLRLLDFADEIRTFIEANGESLTDKR